MHDGAQAQVTVETSSNISDATRETAAADDDEPPPAPPALAGHRSADGKVLPDSLRFLKLAPDRAELCEVIGETAMVGSEANLRLVPHISRQASH